jgi:hypothetical protein
MWPVAPDPARPLGPGGRLLLTAEVLFDYIRARRLMRSTDLEDALSRLRDHAAPESEATAQQHHTAMRLGRAATLILRRLPTDNRCLVRSLAVSGMLARRGIPAQLVLGVRPETSEPFMAHAWVEHGGECVLPDEGFERLHAL